MARAARRPPSAVRGVLAERSRDALFDLSERGPRLVELDIARIAPHPDQPRRIVDEAGIDELARSIEQHGLLQPIVVKADGEGYVLVAGQRRLLAHQRLQRDRITAVLTTGRPDELALIENLQREALAPLDEAEALAALKERYGYTQEQLAGVLAKAKSTISELLSLNDLALPIKDELRAQRLPVTKSVLVEVARARDPAAQLALWRRLKGGGRQTVREARAVRPKRAGEGAPEIAAALAAAQRLQRALEPLEAGTLRRQEPLRAMLTSLALRLDELL